MASLILRNPENHYYVSTHNNDDERWEIFPATDNERDIAIAGAQKMLGLKKGWHGFDVWKVIVCFAVES